MIVDVKNNLIKFGNPEEVIQLKDLQWKQILINPELDKELKKQEQEAILNRDFNKIKNIRSLIRQNITSNKEEVEKLKKRIIDDLVKTNGKLKYENRQWDRSKGLKLFMSILTSSFPEQWYKFAYITGFSIGTNGVISIKNIDSIVIRSRQIPLILHQDYKYIAKCLKEQLKFASDETIEFEFYSASIGESKSLEEIYKEKFSKCVEEIKKLVPNLKIKLKFEDSYIITN